MWRVKELKVNFKSSSVTAAGPVRSGAACTGIPGPKLKLGGNIQVCPSTRYSLSKERRVVVSVRYLNYSLALPGS